MTIIPTIDQLRKDMDSARNDLARIDGQQQGAREELTKLEVEAGELGIAPDKLNEEATRITEDVYTALQAVQAETQALTKETTGD
jgi:uncharacterized protein involved in exopolysaccharide biosynthesis